MKLNYYGMLYVKKRVFKTLHILLQEALHIIIFSFSIAGAFWLTVTLLCYQVFLRVTRSFSELVQGIYTLQGGDFTSRIKISSDDQAGRTARAVNDLADSLQQRDEENRRLTEEQHHLERQMLHTQKLESLGVMAGGIAHDFNNLLQSILGNAELARMELSPASAPHTFIGYAMDSARSAAQLTGLMLAYAGKGLVARKELNLNELVRRNADLLRTAASTSVMVELELPEGLPAQLGDEAQLQQVVMNLVTNAAEATVGQPGLVRITTGVRLCDQEYLAASLLEEKAEPGSFLFLEVCDNGCGMDGDTIARLFEPFFTTKFTGRGLGMSAVMGIMKSHHGALYVESKPGSGTTVRVLFPATDTMAVESSPAPSTAPVETGVFPEAALLPLALVADDEKPVLRICTKMISLCGFRVITASDGAAAVAKFRDHADEIQLVLLDLTMPTMDGIAAMEEIFRVRPDAKVIISSGFNKDELSSRFSDLRPTGFIRKPYSMAVLEAEIQRVLRVE